MLIGEIVLRKRKIEKDIETYLDYINNVDVNTVSNRGDIYNKAINNLFELYSKLQSHNALLEKENSVTEVEFGESTLSVSDALHICRTIEEKIEVLDCIISKNDYSINIEEIIKTRTKLTDEFIALKQLIEVSDWSTNVE